ncbi:hypothetical protein PLICRDRAFT_35224 [Plicaturopsis crispa FD-325 SS-3]|nr:hypothetical protein PLICRDRAFT_35224 [Plicaturopsis crispa FD-325 SS-3]
MDPSDVRGQMTEAICQYGSPEPRLDALLVYQGDAMIGIQRFDATEQSCARLESTRLPYEVSGGLKLGSRLGQLLFNV